MNSSIIIDVETQYSFREVNHDLTKLKVSMVGVYDFATDKYKAYREGQLNELFSVMEHASYLIGFNIRRFDLPVLSPYYLGDIRHFPLVDLLDLVEKSLGHRLSLADLAKGTLSTGKSGHGLQAVEYFRTGQWEKLEKYCLDDVAITKNLYEFALKNRKLRYKNFSGKVIDIPVNLSESPGKAGTVSLSLPF